MTRSTTSLRLPPAAHVLIAAAVLALFIANVARLWFVNDDAYVGFRYARHLVEGYGLVWNPGERVEGYTSFLWVLFAAASLAIGGAPDVVANALSVAAGVGVLFATWRFGVRRFGADSGLSWLAPLLLAANRTFCAWSSSGMEMQFCALLVVLGALRLVHEWERREGAPFGAALLFAVAGLVRPDALLLGEVCGALVVLGALLDRRSWSAVVAFALPFLVLNGVHFLWRRWYYGFWWPNSFYAKVSGLYVARALVYFRLFLHDYPLQWFLPFLALLLVKPRRFEHLLFGALIAAQIVYVLAIGGDWFAFRFLLPALPLLFLLLAEALRRLLKLGAQSHRANVMVRSAALAATALLLFADARALWLPEASRSRDWILSDLQMRNYTRRRIRDGELLRALVDEGRLPADLRIAVGGAGALPYFARLYTFDVLGLNDVEIAHRPLSARGPVGHERSATHDDLVRRRIALFDCMNDLFWPCAPAQLPWRESSEPADYGAPLHCIVIDRSDLKGCLVFTTTLPEDQFRATFHAFEIAF